MRTNKATKRTSWVITAFYLLIVFEFFYMASPFAVYFYSVYKPELKILNHFPAISWLTNFFMPHIAEETKSPIINMLGWVGGVLFASGLLTFIICAVQVYYNKLFKNGAVTGGLYKFIRHPQYTGFIISGLGMLLIWPRFLILITFITILFIYYFLAKIEEKECETKFGKSYTDYKNSTFMFLPFRIQYLTNISLKNIEQPYNFLIFVSVYLFALFISVFLANGIRKQSANTLYATYQENTVNLSITKLEDHQINDLLNIALNNSKIDSLIKPFRTQSDFYFLNYILPADIFYVSEIPMHIPEDINCNYGTSTEKNTIKLIITKAIVDSKEQLIGTEILLHTKYTQAIVEVLIDKISCRITKILYPQQSQRYENIPVPVF